MACMFKTYFELASNNNTGESLAFASVAKISFLVAEITFKVPVITSSVVKITLVDRDHFLHG